MLCPPAGHGHGYDDRVLPLHLHYAGKCLWALARVGWDLLRTASLMEALLLLEEIQAHLTS